MTDRDTLPPEQPHPSQQHFADALDSIVHQVLSGDKYCAQARVLDAIPELGDSERRLKLLLDLLVSIADDKTRLGSLPEDTLAELGELVFNTVYQHIAEIPRYHQQAQELAWENFRGEME